MRTFPVAVMAATIMSCLAMEANHIPLHRQLQWGKEPVHQQLEAEAWWLVGNITIGTPPKRFAVNFDTSTPYTWVPSVNCNTKACSIQKKYNHKESTTYKPNGKFFSLRLYEWWLNGTLSQDTLNVSGIGLKNLVFGEAMQVEGLYEYYSPDGSLGLALTDPGFPTVVSELVRQQLLPKPVYSFYISSTYFDYKKQGPGGQITFGGTDPRHYTGDFTFANVNNEGHFKIDEINVVGYDFKMCKGGCPAIVNSPYPFIQGPPDEVEHFAKKIGALEESPGVFWVPCAGVSALPRLDFVINGKTLKLDFYHEKPESSDCYLYIRGKNRKTDTWVLGATFMMAYYTQFDAGQGRVGFAKSRD